MKQVTCTFKNGKADVKTEGFAGEECKKATDGLNRRLGIVESDEPTPEMFQVEVEEGHADQQ